MMCLEVYELLYFLINNRFNHATEKKTTIFFKVKFVYIGCELQVDHFDHFVFLSGCFKGYFFCFILSYFAV